MKRRRCPDDIGLWPAVVDEPIPEDLARHLSDCPACHRRLHAARRRLQQLRHAFPTAAATDDRPSPPPALEIPGQIGPYAILGVLGQGGQAIVYLAWHPRLGTEVAIKRVLSQAPADAEAMRREAAVLTTVAHPALPLALDLEMIDGELFLLMELIRGEPLANRPPYAGTLQVILELTAAVAELHRAGLLHLDLSPANVLVDQDGQCRLIDFGLARPIGAETDAASPPLAGGTPGFVAPETLSDPHRVDGRADIYGIGAILCFLLTGQPPDPRDGKLPPSAQQRSGGGRLLAICRRALAVNPDERWNSADELLVALKRLESGPSRSRRWLAAATLAASFHLGPANDAAPVAHAEVSIQRAQRTRPLIHAPEVRQGDQVAFAFDCDSPAAGLAVRTPAGRIVPLKPFDRTGVGPFRYPPSGTAVLRQESGTYVVFFVPLVDHRGADAGLLDALERLPAPPPLYSGQRIALIAGQPAEDDLAPASRTASQVVVWRQAVIECRRRFPGLSVIAFRVD